MTAYLVAPEAENDLREIWRFLLGEAGLAIANRIQGELVDAFEGLAEMPGKGHKRTDLTRHHVLFFGVNTSSSTAKRPCSKSWPSCTLNGM